MLADAEEKTDTNTELEETTEEEEEVNVTHEVKIEPEGMFVLKKHFFTSLTIYNKYCIYFLVFYPAVKRGRKRKIREESDEEEIKSSAGANSHTPASSGKGL